MTESFSHTVSTSLPSVLIRFIEKKGLDTSSLLQSISIDQSMLANPETRLTDAQFETLWHEATEMTDDQDFGFSFAKELAKAWRGNNFIFNMMMNCSNVGEALQLLVKYHDIVADAIRPIVSTTPTGIQLSWEYFGPTLKMPYQLGQTLLALYANMLRQLTDNELVLQEVRFTSFAPKNLDVYKKIFRAPLQFRKSENGLLLDKSCLDLQIFLADFNVLTTLEKLAIKRMKELFSENSLSREVGSLINKALLTGSEISLDIIARKLAMSSRNLQIKLKKEGISYQEILDKLRKKIALEHLQEPGFSSGDVAFLLGYSDQSAFNHAFKRWTGKSPQQFRL